MSGLEHNVPSTTVLLNVAKNFEPMGLQLSSHSASSVINKQIKYFLLNIKYQKNEIVIPLS